jgi:flagellar export protein FliJ
MFRFRLERVLHYRRSREEHLERECHRLQAMLQHEEESLETIQAACRGQQEQLEASQGSVLLGEELQQWRRYYQTLEQQVLTHKALILKATEALTSKRQELLGAWQDKKRLEKLAAKAREHYVLEHSRRDQKLVDDIARTRLRYER